MLNSNVFSLQQKKGIGLTVPILLEGSISMYICFIVVISQFLSFGLVIFMEIQSDLKG